MFSEKELNLEETELREQVGLLTPQQQEAYRLCEQASSKRASTYAALNSLFFLGAHHFYLRRWLRGIINLLLGLSAISWIASGQLLYGSVILLSVAIVEIPQLLNYEHLVHSHNNRVMRQCLQQFRKSPR
ncbi:MAG: TM2 domain-containing protein [Gammaproteobacteria bacterium]